MVKLIHLVDHLGLEYITDEYFEGGKRFYPRHDFPEWDYKKNPESAEIPLPDNLASLRFLSFVAFNKNGFQVLET
ncbi:Hypothetical protein Mbur_1405 [Methanococcoides burtonii DSM 6242]|uniref:Uncharacterized protein n=1 Tax=Methanococcoides burtonii (strain DSM 6242 / NBRC 107633 / OCM 468 / ACE-M) TaxID=259564 RepID=Q12W57_METBU|nr:Hypothetical protein Mbur_1405 [Methanococcoides burtonii DSM 6242]